MKICNHCMSDLQLLGWTKAASNSQPSNEVYRCMNPDCGKMFEYLECLVEVSEVSKLHKKVVDG